MTTLKFYFFDNASDKAVLLLLYNTAQSDKRLTKQSNYIINSSDIESRLKAIKAFLPSNQLIHVFCSQIEYDSDTDDQFNYFSTPGEPGPRGPVGVIIFNTNE